MVGLKVLADPRDELERIADAAAFFYIGIKDAVEAIDPTKPGECWRCKDRSVECTCPVNSFTIKNGTKH